MFPTDDDTERSNGIGLLAKEMAGDVENTAPPPAPTSIVIGAKTMERIGQAIINDGNMGTVLTAIIEAAGADANKQWKLHLRGVLVAVEP